MTDTTLSGAAVLQADSTVYVLNARGVNRWWASVQPGQDDEGKRTSDDECKQIAHAIRAALSAAQDAPIDMVLHCPACGMQHIDAPSEARQPRWQDAAGNWHCAEIRVWTNPPHRSHLCHGCGHIWRPADVPTNGVQATKTTGKSDSPIIQPAAQQGELSEFERIAKIEVAARAFVAGAQKHFAPAEFEALKQALAKKAHANGAAPAAQPMFWVRLTSNGMYEGPIHDKQIEDVRRNSGAWSPLYLGAAPAAQGEPSEDANIGKAVNRAARDLPTGWEISIDLERHAGVVRLIDPDGEEAMIEGSGELFSEQINTAIETALAARQKGASNE